jgi:hypothetical protein
MVKIMQMMKPKLTLSAAVCDIKNRRAKAQFYFVGALLARVELVPFPIL